MPGVKLLTLQLSIVTALLLSGCSSKTKHEESSTNRAGVSEKASASASAEEAPRAENGIDPDREQTTSTTVTAHRVIFYEASGVQLKARWLRGRLFPTRPGTPPSLDDPTSFKVAVDEGVTEISLDDLSRVVSSGALKNSKLSNVRISARGRQEIQINATLHRLLPLPIQLTGPIDATPDGRLRIRISSLKVLKMPVKGFLRSMKLNPSDLANVKDSKAIQVDKDSIYICTDELLPPPRKVGRVTAVHFTSGGNLEEDYGTDKAELPERDGSGQNFIRLEGGVLKFGKLTMQNTDLTLIDTSPGDWFKFDLRHYRNQLVAGDMHMTKNGGLIVSTPDAAKLRLVSNPTR